VLIFITGAPAAGKTTLAVPVARSLGLPLLAKDAVKESLHEELGSESPDRAWSRKLSDASYRVLLALLPTVPSAVLDLNLPPELAAEFAALDRLVVQVFCHCPQSEIERRLLERATSRHPAHADDVLLDELRSQGLRGGDPAPFDAPLLEVDTTVPVDVNAVVAWIRRQHPVTRA
jgi:predicted kinase